MGRVGLERIFWSLLNLGLLFSVIFLVRASIRSTDELDGLRAHMESQESKFLEELTERSDLAEARTAQKNLLISSLREEIDQLKRSVSQEATKEVGTRPEGNTISGDSDLKSLTYRPSIQEIPILDKTQYNDLVLRRRKMPRGLSDDALLNGDIDSLLSNKEWNPSGRDLGPEDRLELGVLLRDYLFYTRLSPTERVRNVILPLVDKMREQGAYIEYPADEPPPVIEGVSISHGELTSDRKLQRLYLFWNDDFPELYHAQAVESQRSLETFVRAYEIINVPNR